MASQFQKRLVGTIILVSIGVIFLPDVFDGKKAHFQESFDAIPLRESVGSEIIDVEINEPEEGAAVLPPAQVSVSTGDDLIQQPADTPSQTAEAAKQEPAVAKREGVKPVYQDSAWIIRLGTFRNIENAQNLVDKLRSKGYQAHIFPKDIVKGDLARVEVGPDISKDKLAAMTADLESLTGLKGQVLRFNPLNP